MNRRQVQDGELVAHSTISGGVEVTLPSRFVHLPAGPAADQFWELIDIFACPHYALGVVTAEGAPLAFS